MVRLPRVAAVAELDVEIGDRAFSLRSVGVYALRLALPAQVRSDASRCKFDKKRRLLTVTMPTVVDVSH